MKRTVHRLNIIILAFDVHGRIHVLLVPLQMPAGFPQMRPADVRRINKIIAGSKVFFFAKLFGQMTNQSAVGMPKDEASAQFELVLNKSSCVPSLR